MHLVYATQTHLASLDAPYRQEAELRAHRIPRWLRVRLVLLILLSPSLLATASGALLQILAVPDDLERILDLVVSIAGAASLLLGILFLLANRLIDQLEKDLIACLALGTTTSAPRAKKRKHS